MNVARQVVSFLGSRGLKLVTAESCTAGLIASCLAEVPGSGACLDVGFVTYSPSGKAGFLGTAFNDAGARFDKRGRGS
jgi:nicotinamide mononucleotide (NMN) deamidase PncC